MAQNRKDQSEDESSEEAEPDCMIEVIDESENGETFLVKWMKSKKKTWELIDQIPIKLINQYKRKQTQKHRNEKTKKNKKHKESSSESEQNSVESEIKQENEAKKGRIYSLRKKRLPKVITKVTTITGSNDINMEGKPVIEILSEKDSSGNQILISSSMIAEHPFIAKRSPVCLQQQSAENGNYSENVNNPSEIIEEQNVENVEKVEKVEMVEMVEKAEKVEKVERAGKVEKVEKKKNLKRQRNRMSYQEMPDIIQLVAEVSDSESEPQEINEKQLQAQKNKLIKDKKSANKNNKKNLDEEDNAVQAFMKNYESHKSSKLPQRKNMNFSTFTKEVNRNAYAEDLIILTVLEEGMSGPYKFYKVKLKNGETVLIRQKHMHLHFPRKLQQFYERIINKVTKSTIPINFAL